MKDFRLKDIAKFVKKKYWFLPKKMVEGLSDAIMLQLLMR
jgi:hypothetical protein